MSLDNWVAVTGNSPYGAYLYNEFVESGDINIGEEQSQVTAVYQVDDNSLVGFLDDLLGYSTYFNEEAGNFAISRVLPQQHPQFQGFYARECTAKREGKSSNIGSSTGAVQSQWTVAKVNSIFRPVDYAILNDVDVENELQRYVSRKYNYTIENLTIQGLMQFVTRAGLGQPNPQLGFPPGMCVIYYEKELTWHQVPAKSSNPFELPNLPTILSLGGKVNQTNFDGHLPETVLFAGISPVLKTPRLANGNYFWEITYRFIVKDYGPIDGPIVAGYEAGMNTIYDTIFQRWDLITADGTVDGKRVYETGDLNQLFVIS